MSSPSARSKLPVKTARSGSRPCKKQKIRLTKVRRIFYDRVCKPGSVIDSHLSRRIVADTLQPPSRKQPGRPCFLCGVAPDRVYSNGRFRTPLGALLPHLSTLTSSAQTSYPSPRRKRQVSVIPLRLLSPQNFRFAGPPFLGRGGISLLHFSSDRSGRALPVILALWSPDFPHDRPFGLATRLSVLLAHLLYRKQTRMSTRKIFTPHCNFTPSAV